MNTLVKIRSVDLYRWARQVKTRDNYTCQECGATSRQTFLSRKVAHHIQPMFDAPDLILDINNGKTLCRSCHVKTHLRMIKNSNTGAVIRPMKTKTKIDEQLLRIEDLCWLYRSEIIRRNLLGNGGKEVTGMNSGQTAEALLKMHQVETKYGIKLPEDDDTLLNEHQGLTSEMTTLRWVLDKNAEWREGGLADT